MNDVVLRFKGMDFYIGLETPIEGLLKVKSDPIKDNRGEFIRGWEELTFHYFSVENQWAQDNFSRSKKGVVRGLHFQKHDKAQAKFVKILNGSVMDVVVDLRNGSTTYGQSYWTKLSADGGEMLYIPRGFAHGFLSLENNTIMAYKCDNHFEPNFSSGVIWNDPSFNIPWENWKEEYGIKKFIISEQDKNWEGINNIEPQII